MKTLEEILESKTGKNPKDEVFFPEKEKESDSGECYYYYKCGTDVLKGCSSETTDERNILEKESKPREERNLSERKETEETNFGDYLCGCDSGKCFDCSI